MSTQMKKEQARHQIAQVVTPRNIWLRCECGWERMFPRKAKPSSLSYACNDHVRAALKAATEG
jgi:hypothetical protein